MKKIKMFHIFCIVHIAGDPKEMLRNTGGKIKRKIGNTTKSNILFLKHFQLRIIVKMFGNSMLTSLFCFQTS